MRTTRDVDRPATWLQAGLVTAGFVALLWIVEGVDALLFASPSTTLDRYGVAPRDGEGLLGVVVSPLLHSGFDHLGANTVPTLVLMFLTLAGGIARGLLTTAVIWIVGGLGVWLVSPSDSITVGASGLIFGWLVYLIVRGFVSRRAGEIVLGLVLLFLYGGLLLGVLPGQPGVSWQGHLFGAVGGLVAARFVTEPRAAREAPGRWPPR